jgi:L-lactate dehydrogenase (cytochrome)
MSYSSEQRRDLMGSMTEWLDDHPGGSEIIMSNRSRDVTPIFNPRHPSDQLDKENLPPTVHHLGKLDTESATDEEKDAIRLKVSAEEEEEEERVKRERKEMEERGLGVVVNMKDFEVCLTRLLEIEGDADRRNSLSQC